MQFMRRFTAATSLALTRSFLLLLPPVLAFVLIISNFNGIKQAIADSGIYSRVVPAILDQSAKENTDPQAQALLQDPGVQTAVKQAFSPDFIQSITETAADSVVAWLNGETAFPSFVVDYSVVKSQLTNNLTAYAEQRASTLPTCTLKQLQSFDQNQNVLSIPCIPPGFAVAEAAQAFSNDVVESAGLTQDTTFDASNLATDGQQNVFEAYSYVPEYYQWFTRSHFILGGMIVVLGALYLLLSTNKRVALRRIGWTFIGGGIFWLLGTLLYAIVFSQTPESLNGFVNQELQASAVSLISDLFNTFNRITALVAASYLIIGGIVLVLVRKPRPQMPTESLASETMDPVVDSDTTTSPTTQTKADNREGN